MDINKKKFFDKLIKEASELYIKNKGITGVNSILAKRDFISGAEYLYEQFKKEKSNEIN